MLFCGIPTETQLAIGFIRHILLSQNYRRGKPKLIEMIWLARSFGTGRGRQWGPALGDHLWGTASIFAWQYRNESEYLSLVRAAWCRMLKEAGLLNLGREKSYTDKRNISKYKKAATWKRDYMSSMWAKGKDFQHSEMSRDSWATSRGDTLSIFTGV